MGRAAPSVPIVVLPEQIFGSSLFLGSESRVALDCALRRVSALRESLRNATAPSRELRETLDLAADGMRTLADSIGLVFAIDELGIAETLPVHECFGVRQATQT